jgi:pantoate--beta-alanine ligase
MRVLRSQLELRKLVQASQATAPETRGFVPTMGALHEGHAALFRAARARNDVVIASIYVNPTQFNQAEDFVHYPRTEDDDLRICAEAGVDWVYLPTDKDLYPDGYQYRVTEQRDSVDFEGAHRPGHFDGVLTVVLRLLLQTQPHQAYFGEKDFQQLHLIRGLAAAFCPQLEIVGCPTVRESDGLAMSSRNRRLSPEQRQRAPEIHRALVEAVNVGAAKARLEAAGFTVDYIAESWGRRLAAATLGAVRLIDNVSLDEIARAQGQGQPHAAARPQSQEKRTK